MPKEGEHPNSQSTQQPTGPYLAKHERQQYRKYGKAIHAYIAQHGTPTLDARVTSKCNQLSSNHTLQEQAAAGAAAKTESTTTRQYTYLKVKLVWRLLLGAMV